MDPDDINNIEEGQGAQTPPQPNNLSEAGQAFFSALNTGGAAPATEVPPVVEEGATPAGEIIPTTDPIATDEGASSLEAIKDSIIAEIQALKQGEQQVGTEEGLDLDGDTETPPSQELMTDEEFMEKFSENPMQAITELANSIADQKVQTEMMALAEKMKPVLDQSEEIALQEKVKSVLDEFASMEEYSDAEKYFPQMAELINAKGLPREDINTFINTYREVALNDARANKGKSLDEYLADDNEVAKIIDNPKIKEEIIKQYLQGIAEGKQQPQVISSGGSTATAVTPPTQFNSIKEAGKAFKQSF